MSYYFLASILPELKVGEIPDIGFYELIDLLKTNLSAEDYHKVCKLRRFYDIQNMRALWKGENLDKWGNLDIQEQDEAILTENEPLYVYDFLHRYDKLDERLKHFPQLLTGYFQEELANSSGFLHNYFAFERELRLVLAAFRAKKLQQDVAKALQFEDPSDILVAQILAHKDAHHFEPPLEYGQLKPLFEKHCDHPLELHQALCEYRFEKIGEMIGLDRFSIDRILAFLAQYIIVDKWQELDKIKGNQIIDSIVRETA